MNRWAVSHINFFDNELTTIIVEAPDERSALALHPKIANLFPGQEVENDTETGENELEVEPEVEIEGDIHDTEAFPNLDYLKQAAFDQDAMINVVRVPETGTNTEQVD